MKIGLEIHVQLTTQTKLFCSCPNTVTKEPNTLVCDTCMGFPGSKPTINRNAVEYALKIALALNCRFPKETFFSRKSYFYPDLPKDFQISQYEIPLATGGYLISNSKKIRLIRRLNGSGYPLRAIRELFIEGSRLAGSKGSANLKRVSKMRKTAVRNSKGGKRE